MKRRRCPPDPRQSVKPGNYSLSRNSRVIHLSVARVNGRWTWQVVFANGCWKMEDQPKHIETCTMQGLSSAVEEQFKKRWEQSAWDNWKELVAELLITVVEYEPVRASV